MGQSELSEKDSSFEKTAVSELEKWDRTYYRFRLQIENENNLYNQRLLWFIYIQAFLFATVAIILSNRFGIESSIGTKMVDWITIVICCFGVYLGLLTKTLLDHATDSLNEIRDAWSKLLSTKMPVANLEYFPHVSGGTGKIRTRNVGILRSRYLPLSFSVTWALILIPYLVYVVFY